MPLKTNMQLDSVSGLWDANRSSIAKGVPELKMGMPLQANHQDVAAALAWAMLNPVRNF